MADYYDCVLALVPLVLAGVTGVLTVTGMGTTSAISLGALATFPILGHAMFVRTPRKSPTERLPDAPARAKDGAPAGD